MTPAYPDSIPGPAPDSVPFYVPEDARPATEDARSALEAFRNRHAGQSCFVVGNGPSLARTRLSALQGQWFFGMNRGYLAYSLGLPPMPYYVLGDQELYRSYAAEIRTERLGTRFYQNNVCRTREYLEHREPVVPYPFHYIPGMDEGFFAADPAHGLYRGFTVALAAVQLAYFMGFTSVYLLGCDMTYAQQDLHFYASGGFEESRRHNTIPMHRVFPSFATARGVFEREGRRLVNVTEGSALDVLPRDDFERVLASTPPTRRDD
jgi:hypothetical protein